MNNFYKETAPDPHLHMGIETESQNSVMKNDDGVPVSELLASLPVEIRERIVREKPGLL